MSETLEPKLTKWDRRVLDALDVWTAGRALREIEYRTVWQVAERLREYDCGDVRQTLDALVDFTYAASNGRHDHRRAYVATPWKREAM